MGKPPWKAKLESEIGMDSEQGMADKWNISWLKLRKKQGTFYQAEIHTHIHARNADP